MHRCKQPGLLIGLYTLALIRPATLHAWRLTHDLPTDPLNLCSSRLQHGVAFCLQLVHQVHVARLDYGARLHDVYVVRLDVVQQSLRGGSPSSGSQLQKFSHFSVDGPLAILATTDVQHIVFSVLEVKLSI